MARWRTSAIRMCAWRGCSLCRACGPWSRRRAMSRKAPILLLSIFLLHQLGGFVKDGKRQPIAGANVEADLVLQTFGSSVELATPLGADGGYVLDKMEPGQYALVAKTADRSSDAVRVTLEASDADKEQDLTVDTSPKLRGTVVAQGQRVAGATGVVLCRWDDIQNLCGGAFRSGDSGDFSVVLAPAPDGAT